MTRKGIAMKVRENVEGVLAALLHDEMSIAVGGFGLCGIPQNLIEVVRDSGVTGLTIVSNNLGVDGKGLGLLLERRQIRNVIASYVGENKMFAAQYLDGVLDVEFCPQGTLAERMRSGGAGIAGFYTRTGVGTPVADGKPTEMFDGQEYLLERGIVTDLSLVHAHSADPAGNLRYRYTARNFNPLVATCGKACVAEAEEIVDGYLDPDAVMTPGIYVDHVVVSTAPKFIEQRTIRSESIGA